MDAFVRYSGLELKPGDGGLSCNEHGLWLAGVNLLERTPAGFELRSRQDLEAFTKAGYGRELHTAALLRGLAAVARALNDGDTPRAMIAALHLRLPRLDTEGAERLAKAAGALAKYDPDQPRDWHGRWTAGGTGGPPLAPTQTPAPNRPRQADPVSRPDQSTTRPRPITASPTPANVGSAAAPEVAAPTPKSAPPLTESPSRDSWGGPSYPTGGRLYQTDADGDDDEGEAEGEGEGEGGLSTPPRARVREGWDRPDGERDPTMRNGEPWPRAYPPVTMRILRYRPDGVMPRMVVFIPRDGRGPLLVGSDENGDYEQPEGYDKVILWGTPQVTRAGGVETRHAEESVEWALKYAATNRFSDIYFNRSFMMISRGQTEVMLRPDVTGVVRWELDLGHQFEAHEVLSPGQDPKTRQEQLRTVPGLKDPVTMEGYKLLLRLLRHFGLMK